MKAHFAKLSLALLSTVFLLGCQEQGPGPVGPDTEIGGPNFLHQKKNPKPHGGGGGDPAATLDLADGMETEALPVTVKTDRDDKLKVNNTDFMHDIQMNFTNLGTCVGFKGTNGGTVPMRGQDVFTALLAQLTAPVTNGKVIMNIDKTDLMVDGNTQSGRHQVLVQYDDPVANPIDLGLVRISVGSVFDGVAAATVAWTQPAAGLDVFEFTGPVVVWDAGGGINDQSVIQCPGQTVVVTLNR